MPATNATAIHRPAPAHRSERRTRIRPDTLDESPHAVLPRRAGRFRHRLARLAKVGAVRPLVPDHHTLLDERRDVRAAAEEPEQFVDDAFEVEPFGGDGGEAVAEIEPQLRAEPVERPGPSPIRLGGAVLANVPQEIEILLH